MALQELQVNGSTSPPTQNFGSVAVGAYGEITLVLRNESSPSITINGNVPSLSAPFSIQSGGGAFVLTNHGDTKNIVVRFTPTVSGVDNDTLAITHDAPAPGSPLNVQLAGTGVYGLEATKKSASGEIKVLIYGPTPFTNAQFMHHSPIEHGYDGDDETVFFPSNVKISIFDPQGEAYDRLKLNEDLVEIYRNSNLEYAGKVYLNETRHDRKTKELTILVVDNIQKLKSIKIRDSAGGEVSGLGYADNEYRKIVDLVHDIFKLVNPNVTLSVEHDWEVKASAGPTIDINDAYYNTRCWFGAATLPFEFLSDLLKNIALVWGSIIGMVDYNNAFLVKAYKRDTSNVTLDTTNVESAIAQSYLPGLDGVQIISLRTKTGLSPVDYVRDEGTVELQGVDLKYPDRVLQIPVHHYHADSDAFRFTLFVFDSPSYLAMIQARDLEVDSTFRLFPFADELGSSPETIDHHLGDYYLAYRGNPRERMEFILRGVDYSILDQYSYNSKIYRPAKVSRDFFKNRTTVLAIEVT